MKTLTLTIALVSTLTAFAKPSDVRPLELALGSPFVRITKISNDRLRFEKCLNGYDESNCSPLGRKKSYTLDELKRQRRNENMQIGGSILADVGIAAGILATGGAIGAGYGAMNAGVFGVSMVAEGAATGVGAALASSPLTFPLAVSMIDGANPFKQYDQAVTLNTNILNDENVIVDNIDDYIETLDMVLSKID